MWHDLARISAEPPLQEFVADQYDRFVDSLKSIEKENYIDKFVELDCRGHVWKDKVYQNLIEEFGITQVSWQHLLCDYETQFSNHCIPFPHLTNTLKQIKAKGFLLGMITNGRTKFQSRSIRGLGIEEYFDKIVISETERTRKPESKIFDIAISRLETTAGASVYVGDNPQADIIGAKKAGLRAVWKRNQFWSKPAEADAVIDELDEVLLLLKQWQYC